MSNVLDLDHERRRYRRYSILESGLIYTKDRCLDCQVIDVSANGVRIRPVGKVKASDGQLRFLLGRLGMFEAEVCWEGSDSIGIRFEDAPEAVAERYEAVLPEDCLVAA
jgi:hypothetical protein